MDRNGPEWASITGMDLKIHPKIHVLIEQKFWLSNVTYQISMYEGMQYGSLHSFFIVCASFY